MGFESWPCARASKLAKPNANSVAATTAATRVERRRSARQSMAFFRTRVPRSYRAQPCAPPLTETARNANVRAALDDAKLSLDLLLLSNSSSVRGYLVDALFEITPFARGLREAVFVPYAAVTRSYDLYASRVAEALAPAGLEVRSLHAVDDPVAAVRRASLIIVGGGNTFHLLLE